MKKILATILSIFYLILSVGFISYNVYCQDRLMETSVLISNHSCDKCPNCAEKQCEKDGNCCKHDSDYQQLKVDQNYSSYHIDITPQQVMILNKFGNDILIYTNSSLP